MHVGFMHSCMHFAHHSERSRIFFIAHYKNWMPFPSPNKTKINSDIHTQSVQLKKKLMCFCDLRLFECALSATKLKHPESEYAGNVLGRLTFQMACFFFFVGSRLTAKCCVCQALFNYQMLLNRRTMPMKSFERLLKKKKKNWRSSLELVS